MTTLLQLNTSIFSKGGQSSRLADEFVSTWRAAHPGGLVVAYVNCSAAVKAEADYCCTSGNVAEHREILPPTGSRPS